MSAVSQASYSARLVKPFVEVLCDEGITVPAWFLGWIEDLDGDSRVSAAVVNAMLDAALQLTGDALLGLKAAARTEHGQVGVVDLLMSSASTVRDALEAACRYMRLLDDTAVWRLAVEEDYAVVRLEAPAAIAPTSEDFAVCGLIRNQASSWPDGMLPEVEVWLMHAPPTDPAPYTELVGPAQFRFGSACTGFGFPSRYLEQPLRTGNRHLHDVLRRAAEGALSALPRVETMTERLRRLAIEELPSGEFGVEGAAHALHLSPRTLARRLAQERTTFKQVVEDVRRKVALELVAGTQLEFSEVARRVGFRGVPAFYRAFRRWTGVTPGDYRWIRPVARPRE